MERFGNMRVVVHPLALLSVAAHWTRWRKEKQGRRPKQPQREPTAQGEPLEQLQEIRCQLAPGPTCQRQEDALVIGALLGKSDGKNLEILRSFELVGDDEEISPSSNSNCSSSPPPSSSSTPASSSSCTSSSSSSSSASCSSSWSCFSLDDSFVRSRLVLSAEVFPSLELVGFYAASGTPSRLPVALVEQLIALVSRPFLLLVDPDGITPPPHAPVDAAVSSFVKFPKKFIKVLEPRMEHEIFSNNKNQIITTHDSLAAPGSSSTASSYSSSSSFSLASLFAQVDYVLVPNETERICLDYLSNDDKSIKGQKQEQECSSCIDPFVSSLTELATRVQVLRKWLIRAATQEDVSLPPSFFRCLNLVCTSLRRPKLQSWLEETERQTSMSLLTPTLAIITNTLSKFDSLTNQVTQ
eukprot:GHVT01076235.1.p1 GENE.GHVT01076235.1~~GHVT01076235.1.p1  ORF type:complete len:412 (-),score=116.15 GHVT01076235.1:193-1428(-)